MSRRGHSFGRRHWLAASFDVVRRRTFGATGAARHCDGARPTRRWRQSAGPSAIAHDLQGVGSQDPERDQCIAGRPHRHGARLCPAPARADDHGAVATRRFHQIRHDAGSRQYPVSCAAIVPGKVRRSVASVSGVYRQRRKLEADLARRADTEIRESRRIICRHPKTAASPPTRSASRAPSSLRRRCENMRRSNICPANR